MKVALGLVVIAGIGIGLALPAAKRAPPTLAAPVAGAARAAPVPTHIADHDPVTR